MAQVITLAGEKLFATKAQANQQLDIDTFIFANVAGQDPAAAIDRNEGIPTNAIVHQQNVQQTGRINDNVVVYSTVLDSVTGPFEFNWVGLYSSVNQTLVAISHVPTVAKTITAPGSAGNTLNRNFGIEYSGIADLAGISVSPETWQLDFSARLSGMDELTRNLAKDLTGKDSFIDDGFKVVPRSTANTFSVLPGVGYVNGLRVELEQEHILTLQTYPQFVYVDAYFDGNASSTWKPKHLLKITDMELDDYIDGTGKKHYLVKLAEVTAADEAEDLRVSFTEKQDSYIRHFKTIEAAKNAVYLKVGQRISVEDNSDVYEGEAKYIIKDFASAQAEGYLIDEEHNHTLANGMVAVLLGSCLRSLVIRPRNNIAMTINNEIGNDTLLNSDNLSKNLVLSNSGHRLRGDPSGTKNGNNNTGFGFEVFGDAEISYACTGFGFAALNKLKGGNSNTGIGYQSLTRLTSGNNNTALGVDAGMSLTTGNNNTLVGRHVFFDPIIDATGDNNACLGFDIALRATSFNNMVVIGANAQRDGEKSARSVVIGSSALQKNAMALDSVVIGRQAGQNIVDSIESTVEIGARVNENALSASGNAIVGYNSMFTLEQGTAPTMSNAVLGASAGVNVFGSNNVYIGFRSGAQAVTAERKGQVLIGYRCGDGWAQDNDFAISNNQSESNCLISGNFATKVMKIEASKLSFKNLPEVGSGASGTLWNDGGTLKIIP